MLARTDQVKPTDPVRRIMAEPVATVGTGDSLLSVAQELTAGGIGAVVVEKAQGPAGVISERDIATVVATGGDVGALQAGDVMNVDLVIAAPDDSIESVGRLMRDAGVRHVPIRAGQRLVGLVSIRDVLSVLLPGSQRMTCASCAPPLVSARERCQQPGRCGVPSAGLACAEQQCIGEEVELARSWGGARRVLPPSPAGGGSLPAWPLSADPPYYGA